MFFLLLMISAEVLKNHQSQSSNSDGYCTNKDKKQPRFSNVIHLKDIALVCNSNMSGILFPKISSPAANLQTRGEVGSGEFGANSNSRLPKESDQKGFR